MIQNKFVKAATLIGFFTLLTGFVAYKSGAFNNYLSNNEDKSVIKYLDKKIVSEPPATAVDTPPTTEEKMSPTMLSTSKSEVLIDQKIQFKQDSPKKASPMMIPTSKSAILIDQKIEFNKEQKIEPQIPLPDSVKKQKPNQKPQKNNKMKTQQVKVNNANHANQPNK